MRKYYNKDIPTEIHVVYGGRHTGKTYYEFNKIKYENERLKKELEEEKKAWKDMLDSRDKLVIRIGKAINYIEELYTRYIADYSDIERLEKILKGEDHEN